MDSSPVRSNFLPLNPDSSNSIKYVTSFSQSSIILSLAIGIFDLYARFKEYKLVDFVKLLTFGLNNKSNEAKTVYPDYSQYIDFYMGFINSIKSSASSFSAFQYIDHFTITAPSNYLSIIESGFKCILATLFKHKPDYAQMIMNNIELEKFRMLILYRIVQDLGFQIDIYDGTEKESVKYEKLGEFPILNLFVWNCNYWLAYTEEMYEERCKADFNPELKRGPSFVVCTKKALQPIAREVKSENAGIVIDFANTVQVLTEIVKSAAGELLKGQYSEGFSKFVEDCMKRNADVGSILILKKFVNPIAVNSTLPVASRLPDQEAEIIISSDSGNFSQQSIMRMCSVCRNRFESSCFAIYSHNTCNVCIRCAVRQEFCPKCLNLYTSNDRFALRLPL